jgi:hypothetical protein
MDINKELLVIMNKGSLIKETNFWETDHNKHGLLFMSVSAGHIRLLLPDEYAHITSEIQTGHYAVLSKGKWSGYNRDGIEIMFEDYTVTPFAIHLSIEQTDMIPKDDERWRISVYTKNDGKVIEKACKVRTVKEIPCLRPWKND